MCQMINISAWLCSSEKEKVVLEKVPAAVADAKSKSKDLPKVNTTPETASNGEIDEATILENRNKLFNKGKKVAKTPPEVMWVKSVLDRFLDILQLGNDYKYILDVLLLWFFYSIMPD